MKFDVTKSLYRISPKLPVEVSMEDINEDRRLMGAGMDLKQCPFCGCTVRIESNRDWHHLRGDHDDDCIFVEDTIATVPATDEQLLLLIDAWNKRHS